MLVQQPLDLFEGSASFTVTSFFFLVMMADTGCAVSVSNRMSLRVTMPTRLPASITGTPEMPFALVKSIKSAMLAVLSIVMGSFTTPLKFLNAPDFLSLLCDRHILVNDADAAFLRQSNGKTRLGNGIHGGRYERDIQWDIARQACHQ